MTIEEKREILRKSWDAGETHLPAYKAAPILNSDPQSIRCRCREGKQAKDSYFFSGNRCKISIAWMMRQLGMDTKSPGDVAASTEAGIKARAHYTTTAKEAQVPC